MTVKLDNSLTGSVADKTYLRLDTTNDPLTGDLETPDVYKTRDGVVTYTNGKLSRIAKAGGRTLDLTRDAYKNLASYTDGTKTWTLTRASDNSKLASWAVT